MAKKPSPETQRLLGEVSKGLDKIIAGLKRSLANPATRKRLQALMKAKAQPRKAATMPINDNPAADPSGFDTEPVPVEFSDDGSGRDPYECSQAREFKDTAGQRVTASDSLTLFSCERTHGGYRWRFVNSAFKASNRAPVEAFCEVDFTTATAGDPARFADEVHARTGKSFDNSRHNQRSWRSYLNRVADASNRR